MFKVFLAYLLCSSPLLRAVLASQAMTCGQASGLLDYGGITDGLPQENDNLCTAYFLVALETRLKHPQSHVLKCLGGFAGLLCTLYLGEVI